MAKNMQQTMIKVKRGETYCVLRAGKRAAIIRVIGVTRSKDQPKITYDVISSSGKVKDRLWYFVEKNDKRERRELKRTHWLTWRDGAWQLPEGWDRIELRCHA